MFTSKVLLGLNLLQKADLITNCLDILDPCPNFIHFIVARLSDVRGVGQTDGNLLQADVQVQWHCEANTGLHPKVEQPDAVKGTLWNWMEFLCAAWPEFSKINLTQT